MPPVLSSRATARSIPRGRRPSVKSMTNTRPSETEGPEKPLLIGVRQRIFNPLAGNASRIPVSFQTPARPLPRNSGQSSARRLVSPSNRTRMAATAPHRAMRGRGSRTGIKAAPVSGRKVSGAGWRSRQTEGENRIRRHDRDVLLPRALLVGSLARGLLLGASAAQHAWNRVITLVTRVFEHLIVLVPLEGKRYRPRRGVHFRIVDRDLVLQGVAVDPCEAFHHVQGLGLDTDVSQQVV